MSRRVYFMQRQITFSQFADVLEIPSLEVKLYASSSNFYPSVRPKLGDASLMARTNMDGHVFQLDAIRPDSDGHRKIANIIAELFNTEITRIAILARKFRGYPIRGFRKGTGILIVKNEVPGVR
jgi:hypothetical protein